ncbi:MAG: NEW3 domain-containing protein [Carboxydocellales bacterium]
MPNWKYLLIAFLLCFNLTSVTAFAENILSSQSSFPGQEIHYGLLITNLDAKAHVYNLQTKLLPQGFDQMFFQEKQVIRQISIPSGQAVDIVLQVAIPSNAKKGNNQFLVKVVREDKLQTSIPLNLKVDNSYLLQIVSSNSNLNAFSGKTISVPVSVSNFGHKELTGVKLSFDLPHKWLVVVTPEKLASLKAGESANYQVKVTIPPTQDAGNQKITITATADQALAQAISVPIKTQKSTNYLFIPIAVVFLIFVGGLVYFKKQGRR